MKKALFKVAALVGIAVLSYPLVAESANTTFQASANVFRNLVITTTQDLQFGDVSENGTGGTIVVPIGSDTQTATGGAVALGGTVTRARFDVRGRPNVLLNVTINGSAPNAASVNITCTGGGACTPGLDTLTVSNFTCLNITRNENCSAGTLPSGLLSGINDVAVGGTLTLPAGAEALDGTYVNPAVTIEVLY